MHRNWLRFLAGVVLFMLVWITVRFPFEVEAAIGHLLGGNRVDPLSLHVRGEFVENNLGSALEPDGSVTTRVIAQQYVFVPQCLLVPAGVTVHLRITSADAAHEFTVNGTDYRVKVLPGTISKANLKFSRVGDYAIPCGEFCGPGHFTMRAKLMVVPRDQFRVQNPDERLTCEAH